jgi:Na+-translocating ferredoxin:NAD+ oxidoreductase RNF subunit RnfB
VGRLLAQFTDLFAVVLLVAAAITLLAYLLGEPRDVDNLQLAIAILAVVLINALIGFGQEYTAERTAEASVPGERYEIDYDYCKGCGLCVAECPSGAIEMVPEDT